MIDYIMVRRENLWELKNCKVIPGESVATQHRMLEMKAVRKRMSPRERTKRTRWWKLNQEELREHLEGEGTSQLFGSRGKRNTMEGDIF